MTHSLRCECSLTFISHLRISASGATRLTFLPAALHSDSEIPTRLSRPYAYAAPRVERSVILFQFVVAFGRVSRVLRGLAANSAASTTTTTKSALSRTVSPSRVPPTTQARQQEQDEPILRPQSQPNASGISRLFESGAIWIQIFTKMQFAYSNGGCGKVWWSNRGGDPSIQYSKRENVLLNQHNYIQLHQKRTLRCALCMYLYKKIQKKLRVALRSAWRGSCSSKKKKCAVLCV